MEIRTHNTDEIEDIARSVTRKCGTELPVSFEVVADRLGFLIDSHTSLSEYSIHGTHSFKPDTQEHTIHVSFEMASKPDDAYDYLVGEEIAHILLMDDPPTSIEDTIQLHQHPNHRRFEFEAQILRRALKMPFDAVIEYLGPVYRRTFEEFGTSKIDEFLFNFEQNMADIFGVTRHDFLGRIKYSRLVDQQDRWHMSAVCGEPDLIDRQAVKKVRSKVQEMQMQLDFGA